MTCEEALNQFERDIDQIDDQPRDTIDRNKLIALNTGKVYAVGFISNDEFIKERCQRILKLLLAMAR